MPSSGVQTCALDRKSTRLNSSHTLISYAVFCLKKEKRAGFSEIVEGRNGVYMCERSVCVRLLLGDQQRRALGLLGVRLLAAARAVFFLKERGPPGLSPLPLPAPLPI